MSLLTFSSTGAQAETIHAALTGIEEVPVVSTLARGEVRATINRGDQSSEFELRYSGLQGTVQQGHIHAQPSVNGSIVVRLCQTATNLDPTGLAETCQLGQATEAVTRGTNTSANVIAGSMTGQQLTAGDPTSACMFLLIDHPHVDHIGDVFHNNCAGNSTAQFAFPTEGNAQG